jgi:hypothetical protein
MCYANSIGSLLVTARKDVPVRITHILFDQIRERCAKLGVHEGDEVRCLGVSDESMSLAVTGGGVVDIALMLCVCIQVEATDAERPRWQRARTLPMKFVDASRSQPSWGTSRTNTATECAPS